MPAPAAPCAVVPAQRPVLIEVSMSATLQHPAGHAVTSPDKPAYIMAGSGETVTYAQLEVRSNRAAHLLRSHGLRPGDAVAVLMHNHPCFMEVIWAAQRAGLIFTTISTHLTAAEIAYILRDCGARALLCNDDLAERAAAACELAPQVSLRLLIDGYRPGFIDYAIDSGAMPRVPIADECAGREMLYSSGTTGQPKGIALEFKPGMSIDTMLPALDAMARLFRFDADTVYLSTAPLYHAAPLRFVMMTMFLGGTAVIMERFDAQLSLQLLQRYNVTHSQWVPIMFTRLLALPEQIRAGFSSDSHRLAIHAAAPCPVPVKRAMIDWWGPIIHEYYGSTEAIGVTAIDSEQWIAHPGSVGRALVGRPRIIDEATGEELPPGQTGTLYFSDGPAVHYHNDPEKSAAARNDRGWYTCGDIGYLDDEGYLYLTDRKAFTIISGGVNVYPQETENTLALHPAVADVAVIGVPDAEFGEAVLAVVQLHPDHHRSPQLAAELIEFCRARISHIKCPRAIDFMTQLPRFDNGKLYKQALKARYQAGNAIEGGGTPI
jgi:acyl-CoA synthetase (AMP-forming)/AMP-acid ligase II